MKTLVFEIGTEEMPAGAAKSAVEQLRAKGGELLADYRLIGEETKTALEAYVTPRRLALVVSALPERQAAAAETIKGPPASVAFTPDGAPTPAALGFARTQGVDVKDLQVRQVDGGEYVFALKEAAGQPSKAVLPELLTTLVRSLEFPKTMRWGRGELRFIRPIRWLLALWGTEIVPLELDGLSSGRLTWGHRFLAEGPFKVASAEDYRQTIQEAKVIFSNETAKTQTVKEMIEAAAEAAGGRAAINPRVLDEVLYLVEDPHIVIGTFDREFLRIPRIVVVTAMESHQRYFPVEDKQGRLMPLFAVVHNGDPKSGERIARGHERVLRARLADAAFFFHEDSRTTLDSKVDRLKSVVWQAQLGTVFEKAQRLRRLAGILAQRLDLGDRQKTAVDRAARLAKADLTSSMVIEFTDLQGEIGREYALVDGEDSSVAEAIAEHWRPRFAGDVLPATVTGQIVALADKIDTIAGCFLVGLVPSGSADPYSLRRQAAGIVGILGATRWRIGILELIESAIDSYAEVGITSADPKAVAAQLQGFIFARLKRSLVDDGARPDTVEAVCAAGFDSVDDIAVRVRLIDDFEGQDQLEDIKIAFTRCQNLARPELGDEAAPDLFEHDEEGRLFDKCRQAKVEMDKIMAAGPLGPAIGLLASLRGPIDDFFEVVLVMAPDDKVRANRLRLLNLCLSVSGRVADFSKL